MAPLQSAFFATGFIGFEAIYRSMAVCTERRAMPEHRQRKPAGARDGGLTGQALHPIAPLRLLCRLRILPDRVILPGKPP